MLLKYVGKSLIRVEYLRLIPDESDALLEGIYNSQPFDFSFIYFDAIAERLLPQPFIRIDYSNERNDTKGTSDD